MCDVNLDTESELQLLTESGDFIVVDFTCFTCPGSLYRKRDAYYPRAQQPGGPDTPVTAPIQTGDELTGHFKPGCGHSIGEWEIIRTSCFGVSGVMVCCPLCGYVQNLFVPASSFDNSDITT